MGGMGRERAESERRNRPCCFVFMLPRPILRDVHTFKVAVKPHHATRLAAEIQLIHHEPTKLFHTEGKGGRM